MIRYVLAGALVVTSAAPALADFYIVRGPDKKCTVVEEKPATETTVIVGDTVFQTREEAEKQISVVCKEM